MPFSNPYMANSNEVVNSRRSRRPKDFTLADTDTYMLYYNRQGSDPIMLLEGTPWRKEDGSIGGVMPMLCPNHNVPLDALFNSDPDAFADGIRTLFYPSNICAIKTVRFVGPRKINANDKVIPGLSFLDDFPPSVKAQGNPGLTAFDMLWAKAESVAAYNPAWRQFVPSRGQDARSAALPEAKTMYYVRALLYSCAGMHPDDKWNNPYHAVIPLTVTGYRSLANMAFALNPNWDRSRVRTHNDLYDPANRPFMHDLVNAYGASPCLTLRYTPGSESGNAGRYAQRQYSSQSRNNSGAPQSHYDFRLFASEVGADAGKIVLRTASDALKCADMAAYMQARYVEPERLFNYLSPIDVLKTILENSLDLQWSLFIQKCLEGSEAYAALTELFDNAEAIVAHNVVEANVKPDTLGAVTTAPTQVYGPASQPAAGPQSPAYPGQGGYSQPVQPPAQQMYQAPASHVQMPPPQSPLAPTQPPPQQPAPPVPPRPAAPAAASPGGVFAPGYGMPDPASTALPGANPAAIEAQLRGAAPDAPTAPFAPMPPSAAPQHAAGWDPFQTGPSAFDDPDDVPF
jgi:hypothetical protein